MKFLSTTTEKVKTKQVPMKFNNEQIRDLEDLEDLLGIRDIYGAAPKAIKLAIKLAIFVIRDEGEALEAKVILSLNQAQRELYLASISKPAKELAKQDRQE